MTMPANSAADLSWSLTPTEKACRSPSSVPLGMLTEAAASAVRIAAKSMP